MKEATTTQPQPNQEALNAMSPDTRDFYLQRLTATKSAMGPTVYDKAYANATKMEKIFYDMGGLLSVGTYPTGNGGTIAGYGNWRAIELLVEADGFTPLEAIKIATLNGSIALGFDKTVGTIETGKSADLLIIHGDPSNNFFELYPTPFLKTYKTLRMLLIFFDGSPSMIIRSADLPGSIDPIVLSNPKAILPFCVAIFIASNGVKPSASTNNSIARQLP